MIILRTRAQAAAKTAATRAALKKLRRIIMTTANQKKPIKSAVVATYAAATILLIAGWFIPAFGYGQDIAVGDMMLIWYIPAIINAMFARTVIPESALGGRELPAFITEPEGFNAPALLLIVYLIMTVLAIIFLIPVLSKA